MKKTEASSDFFKKIWDVFASIRLSVILLVSLAATSIIGTVIPQNRPLEEYQAYGPVLFKIFSLFNLIDMYHSGWFQLLLFLLMINIVVCSMDRLSTMWKFIFEKQPKFRASRFTNSEKPVTFIVDKTAAELKKSYELFIAGRYRHCKTENTDKKIYIFGEKGRLSRLGVYTVHLSVVLLLIGGLIGSIFGFEGFVTIPEGGAVDHVRLRKSGAIIPLGFVLRCDDFDVSFYSTGAPKQYRSTLAVIENDKTVFTKNIIVNDPLRYKGINVYQSSYGSLPPERLTLNFTMKESQMVYKEEAAIGKKIDLPEGMGTFELKHFTRGFRFMEQHVGEAFIGTLTPREGEPVDVALPIHFPNFDKMRKGDVFISIADIHQRHYTGLQITKDPGVNVVYVGFIVMIAGFLITFFMSHQRVCIELEPRQDKTRVAVFGVANKNKMAMEVRMERLARRLSEMTGTKPLEYGENEKMG